MNRDGTRRRLAAAVAMLVVLLVACGSTAQPQVSAGGDTADGVAALQPSDDGLSLVAPDAESSATDQPGTAGPTGGAATPAAGRTGSTPGTAGSTEATATPDGSSTERGTPTDDGSMGTTEGPVGEPIEVGVAYLTDMNEMSQALGYEGAPLDPGDGMAQSGAVIDYINDRGGLAGRPIEPVYYAFSATAVVTGRNAWEEACSLWTEDHDVTFVAAGPMNGPLLLACLAKKGVPMVSAETDVDQELYDLYGDYYYQPAWPKMERLGRLVADGFLEQGMLTPDDTLGIIHWDVPSWTSVVENVTIPRLAANGIVPEVVIAAPGFAEGNYQGYVVQMRSAGVTHVMFMGEKNGYPWFFSDAAESQGYRPTYLVTSDNKPFALEGLMQPAQLRNVVALGWQPTVDVSAPKLPPNNETADLCLRIMADAGQDMSTSIKQNQALRFCDQLFLLREGVGRTGQSDAAGLLAGVESLGDAFLSPNTFSSTFGVDRHDGPNTYRPIAIDDGCTCFEYIGGEFVMSGG